MPPGTQPRALQRFQGLEWGDGVRDDAVYFDGHTFYVDVVGQDTGVPAIQVRSLNPVTNAPSSVWAVNKDGGVSFAALSATSLTLTAAVSKIVPGGTSLSLRDHADANDNLLVLDNGGVTIRNGLTVNAGGCNFNGDVLLQNSLKFATAASKIIPGGTSISLRDNADVHDNLLMLDNGQLTVRASIMHGSATLLATSVSLTNGAAANTATLTNAPAAGNPTKWVPIIDNGTTRYVPTW